MSASLNNIFNFSRPLPPPFDTLANKKVTSVSSQYGDGTASTLNCTVIKAVQAMCGCMSGKTPGAVGVIDHRSVAEYKSSTGPDDYHIAVYDSSSGAVLASVYNANDETLEVYTLNQYNRDGAAVLLAIMPTLLKDDEFREQFEIYYEQYLAGHPDMSVSTNSMAMLCDNVYRRIKDETCPAHVKVDVDSSGNVARVSQAQLDSGAFTPNEVVAGEFTIFARTGPAVIKRAGAEVEHDDFVGKYEFHPRSFTPIEQMLIPKLPDWYVIPKEIVDICKHAQATTGKPTQMRNFLLRGPAGTGKTMGAKAIAAGLHLPYMKYTCSSGTEIFDFIGQIFPDTEGGSTGNAELDRELAELKSMGGINYTNVAKLMKLPDLDDMDYDPAGVYKRLTGIDKEDATSQDCMGVVLGRVTEKVRLLSARSNDGNGSQSFTYVETDFIKALKNGYLVEIQEPTTITQPGVLVGLNSLLEQDGSITLPTGEIIERHPDTVVVVTTNISYEGCRGMNQSVVDRMSLVRDIDLPTPEVMVQRAMSVTGETDEHLVSQMVQVVNDIADYCRKNSITDGSCGMRSLIDWIVSTEITGDPYTSAMYTVVSKATNDETDREAIIAAALEPIFAPGRRRASKK